MRDVVAAVRGNLRVDWTKAHRRDVYASVQSAVSRVMKQAEASYEDWPMAA